MRLRRRQRWDDAGVAEARERFDVVGVPLGVYTSIRTSLLVEHGLSCVRLLAFRYLAFAVKVPVRLGQCFNYFWVLPLQGVENVMRAHDI